MKRAELHIHTKLSDDLATVHIRELLQRAACLGLSAVAFTNLNNVQDFPEVDRMARDMGVQIIYGAELVCQRRTNGPLTRMTVLVRNQAGLKDLYKIISALETRRKGRVLDVSVLADRRTHLLVGSCGSEGELYAAIRNGAAQKKLEEIAAFYDYLEIYPGIEAEEQAINQQIVALGKRLNIPVVATSNAHYLSPEDGIFREILHLTGKVAKPDQGDRYVRSAAAMLAEMSYLGGDLAREVVLHNPQKIADAIEAVIPIPRGCFAVRYGEDFVQIQTLCLCKARAIYGDSLPAPVSERLHQELTLIEQSDFANQYLQAYHIAKHLAGEGHYVCCSGLAGSSLVAFLLGITQVNPLPPHYVCPHCHYFQEDDRTRDGVDLPAADCPHCHIPLKRDGHDIPYEVFMGFHGDRVPYFDFRTCAKGVESAIAFLQKTWGESSVALAGTIHTLQEGRARVLISKYEEQMGAAFPQGIREKIFKNLVGVKWQESIFPGGVMLFPEGWVFEDCTPVHQGDIPVTHMEYRYLYDTIPKLNLLTYYGALLVERLSDRTGVSREEIPLHDPDVLRMFTEARTEGIPEFSNSYMRELLNVTKPETFWELVKLNGLSHGSWLTEERDALIPDGIPLSKLPTLRDDIMQDLMSVGIDRELAFRYAERVRKGKMTDSSDPYYEDFQRDTRALGDWYGDYCSKILYLFPKAHAVTYTKIAVRCAWFMRYYPREYAEELGKIKR